MKLLVAGAVFAATAFPAIAAVAREQLQDQVVLGNNHFSNGDDPFGDIYHHEDDGFDDGDWESKFHLDEVGEEESFLEMCGRNWDNLPPPLRKKLELFCDCRGEEDETKTEDDELNGEALPLPDLPPKFRNGFPWPGKKPDHSPGEDDGHHKHPKKPKHPPHKGPKHPGKKPPCKRPGHHHPPRLPWPPHIIRPDQTIYELIAKSNHSTKLFALIKNDTEIVQLLNSTSAKGITFFAPSDRAFEHIPGHGGHHPHENDGDDDGDKPKHPPHSPEFIKSLLLYHLIPDAKIDCKELYFSKTIPTALKSKDDKYLPKGTPQRIRVFSSIFFGTRINFLSKVILSIEASNGIIYVIDHILIPPPPSNVALGFLPTRFGQTLYALLKTGFEFPEGGKTFFPPPNSAWTRLGYRINAFLFSKWGEKLLTALLKYHVAPRNVLYSDYYLMADGDNRDVANDLKERVILHIDLPSLLQDKIISIDITEVGYKGKWIIWKINGGTGIIVRDVVVADGVIQVPNRVLIPPHKCKKPDEVEELTEKQQEAWRDFQEWKASESMIGMGEGIFGSFGEMNEKNVGETGSDDEVTTVEELVERLLPYVE